MENLVDPVALKAIALVQRPGKPDLLKQIVEQFKFEYGKYLAASQRVMDSSELKASIAEQTRHVSTPA